MGPRRAQRRTGFRPGHGRSVAALLVAGGLGLGALSACSNGVEAGTLDTTAWTGARVAAGDVLIRNAVLVAGEDGGLSVSMTLVNSGAEEDALTGLVVEGSEEPAAADLRPASIPLPPGVSTRLPGDPRPTVVVDADVAAGVFLPVTFEFEHAGTITASLLVVDPSNPHAGTDAG